MNLNCTGGAPVPPPILDDWAKYLAWQADAQRAFGKVLEPAMLLPGNAGIEQVGDAFCAQHGIEREEAIAALRGVGFFLSRAAALDLSVDLFQKDAAQLCGENAEAAEILVSRYAASKPSLRQAILGAAITDHGKVLTNVHWRLDQVTASDRGADLQATIVQLTLEYADQPTPGRITLQLTPEGIQQLKAFADRFGG
jgi:hypothetical protein